MEKNLEDMWPFLPQAGWLASRQAGRQARRGEGRGPGRGGSRGAGTHTHTHTHVCLPVDRLGEGGGGRVSTFLSMFGTVMAGWPGGGITGCDG